MLSSRSLRSLLGGAARRYRAVPSALAVRRWRFGRSLRSLLRGAARRYEGSAVGFAGPSSFFLLSWRFGTPPALMRRTILLLACERRRRSTSRFFARWRSHRAGMK